MPSPTAVTAGTVASLHRCPVKSMMGEEVEGADITERGIAGDRGYALVDNDTGQIVSAKNPRKWASMFECRAEYVEPPPIGQPLPAVRITLPDGTAFRSDDADALSLLSQFSGREVTLKQPEANLAIFEHFWFEYQAPIGRPVENPEGDSLTTLPLGLRAPQTFFDYTPLHLLTTSTLAKLRELYQEGRWEARRFRPNIVIEATDGEGGYVEDSWIGKPLTVGDVVRLEVIDTMVRCVMTTLPQGDLPNDPAILRTVADHHRVLMPVVGKELPAVGVAVTVTTGGRISRGDSVTVEPAE